MKLDGETVKSKSVKAGTTVHYEVSKDGYVTQAGDIKTSPSATDNTLSKPITLVRETATVTINPNPADAAVKLGGETKKTGTYNVGDSVSYEVSKTGYVTQTGNVKVVSGGVVKSITLVATGG